MAIFCNKTHIIKLAHLMSIISIYGKSRGHGTIYVAAARAYFMIGDHSGSHLGQKLDHNRKISTSVVLRSCVGVIMLKMETNQTDSVKGCFLISIIQSAPLLFFFKYHI